MSYDEQDLEPEESLEQRVDRLERTVAALQRQTTRAGSMRPLRTPATVRARSGIRVLGLPLYDIAMGPDPEKGEIRGHAKGILAIGDMATGMVALGGFSRGIISLGGLALGVVSFGGGAIGLCLALGGAAVGGVAIGGGAVGIFAKGGGAFGVHATDAARQDPQAVQFFNKWFPGF